MLLRGMGHCRFATMLEEPEMAIFKLTTLTLMTP
jgi:hypothetical protein